MRGGQRRGPLPGAGQAAASRPPCPASTPLPSRSAAGGGGRAAEGSCARRRGLRGGQAETHVGLLFPRMHLPRQRALGLTGSGSVAGGQGGRGGGGRRRSGRQQRRRGEEEEEV